MPDCDSEFRQRNNRLQAMPSGVEPEQFRRNPAGKGVAVQRNAHTLIVVEIRSWQENKPAKGKNKDKKP